MLFCNLDYGIQIENKTKRNLPMGNASYL